MVEYVKFNPSDVMVVFVLWFYELVNFWVGDLSRHTFFVLSAYPNFQWISYNFVASTVLLVGCAAVVIVGILVEAYGHKYVVSLVGLCLCTTTPFIATFTCITKLSPGVVPLISMVIALFVVCPASYGLIFNQKLHPIRRQARLMVSFCDFMTTLFGKYLSFILITQEVIDGDKELLFVIVAWVVVATILFTLIIFVHQMRSYVTGDFVIEKGVKELMYGVRRDIKEPSGNGLSVIQVTFFILLVLPALVISSLDEALTGANSDVQTQTQNPQLKHIVFSSQVLVIPFMELFISLVPYCNERTREMAVLSWVHLNNVVVMSLFIYRMEKLPPKRQPKIDFKNKRDETLRSNICVDETCETSLNRPSPGIAAWILIVSTTARLNSKPPLFRGGEESETSFTAGIDLLTGSYHLPKGKRQISMEFTYTHDKPEPAKSLSGKSVVTLFGNKQHVYLITSDNSTYIEFRSTYFEVIITRAPTLIFFNLYIGKSTDEIVDTSEHVTIGLSSKEIKFEQIHHLPEPDSSAIWELPVASVQANLKYYEPKTHLLKTDEGTFQTETFSTYLSFLYGSKALRLAIFKYKNSPPEPPFFKNLDAIQKTIYALFGAGLGVASVGYTHFFWVESPLRLRAFLYAVLRMSIELIRYIIRRIVGRNFTYPQAVGLLLLQLVTTVWHLVISWIFHTKIHPEFH